MAHSMILNNMKYEVKVFSKKMATGQGIPKQPRYIIGIPTYNVGLNPY